MIESQGTSQSAAMYSPYAEHNGHNTPSGAAASLTHSSSLPRKRQSSSCRSSGASKLAGLTRSQLAEQKHIKRQNSFTDASIHSDSVSTERSRPSSASQRSSQHSLSREPSGKIDRRLSSAGSYAAAAAQSYYSRSRSSSRPTSPGHASHTIPAYNPLHSSRAVTPSYQLPSRHSLGTSTQPVTDPVHLSATVPRAPLLRRFSSAGPSGGHPYAAQASESWGQHQQHAKKRNTSSQQASGPQDFLSVLERSKQVDSVQSAHPPPARRSSSREFLERPGQFMWDKIQR